jgi:hypothetical protein
MRHRMVGDGVPLTQRAPDGLARRFAIIWRIGPRRLLDVPPKEKERRFYARLSDDVEQGLG